MIDAYFLFKGNDFVVNEHIKIHHPTLDEVFEFGRQRYANLVSIITAVPFDYKVKLYDMNIDYETMSDFELFILNITCVAPAESSIFFGDLDFTEFVLKRDENNEPYLENKDGVIINSIIYVLIVNFVRQINHLKRNNDVAGNIHAKKYLIEKDRKRMLRQKNKPYEDNLLNLVSFLVNISAKYDYENIWNLKIYVFYDSIKRIQKLLEYVFLMIGIYTGNVDGKNLSSEKLNLIGTLDK